MIEDNIKRIKEKIARASERTGRQPSEVLLVAVSKFHPSSVIDESIRAGQWDFGENYVQELLAKSAALEQFNPRWHLIGHLQTNKIRKILPVAVLIHSVDSLRLLQEINRAGQNLNIDAQVLLEINLSGELGKTGFEAAALPSLSDDLQPLSRVKVNGLMTMTPNSAASNERRAIFAGLRRLRDRLCREWGPDFSLSHLSMGMSDDFETAVEEGATIVRVGTAIFGDRNYASTRVY